MTFFSSFIFLFSNERMSPTRSASTRPPRLSAYSGRSRYFDFLDPSRSVFSREYYYDDLKDIHPWLRRPRSRNSGIALATLQAGPCTTRVEQLAKPKIKREKLIRQGKEKKKLLRAKNSTFVFLFNSKNFSIIL